MSHSQQSDLSVIKCCLMLLWIIMHCWLLKCFMLMAQLDSRLTRSSIPPLCMEPVIREATIVKNEFDGELLVWFSLIDSLSEKVYWTKKKKVPQRPNSLPSRSILASSVCRRLNVINWRQTDFIFGAPGVLISHSVHLEWLEGVIRKTGWLNLTEYRWPFRCCFRLFQAPFS